MRGRICASGAATPAALADPANAWWAHVGGFMAGLVLTPIAKAREVPLLGRSLGPWER